MVVKAVDHHRTERVEADGEFHGRHGDAVRPQGLEDGRGEVQASSGRSGRERPVGVDGLVPGWVVDLVCDVRRKRRKPDLRQPIVEVGIARVETHNPTAVAEILTHLDRQPLGSDNVAGLQLLARLRERLPRTIVALLKKQDLGGATGGTTNRNPSRQDFGVVDDDKIAGMQQVGQVAHMAMLDTIAPVDKQPGGVTRLDRFLGDTFRREVVVDIGERLRAVRHPIEGTSFRSRPVREMFA